MSDPKSGMIVPRYDDDGVPWCDADCPKYWRGGRRIPSSCEIDQFARSPRDVCPHAVKEMTARIAELEDLVKRINKAARLEDLQCIAELEKKLAEAEEKQRLDERQCDEMTDEAMNMAVEIAALRRDKARLDALESPYLSGCAVVSDENGHFAVTVSRWTSPSGALENEWPVEVMFLIDEDELFDSIRAAIDAARAIIRPFSARKR